MELEIKQSFKQTEVGLIPEDWRVVKLHKTLDKENLPSGLYKDKNLYGDGSKIIKLGDVFAYDYFQPQFAQRVKISKEESINYQTLIPDPHVAKISVIGVGMRSHVGVAQQMFQTFAEKGINIQVISTSEIKVSVLIAEGHTELALRALHSAYGLDAS